MNIKLHLGCGRNYKEGWINIDAPNDEIWDKRIKADKYSRIEDLEYEPASVSEILLEAVFEHFPRHKAIFLLRKFYEWLENNGTIMVLVPDFWEIVKKLKKSKSPQEQQFWWRHLFGPQDTIKYGTHYDGFDINKLKYIFRTVGFTEFKYFKDGRWPSLRFIAKKTKPFLDTQLARENIIKYLSLYESPTENGLIFSSWIAELWPSKLP
jgi:hypothetical protein